MGARNTEQENMEPSIDMDIIATTVFYKNTEERNVAY